MHGVANTTPDLCSITQEDQPPHTHFPRASPLRDLVTTTSARTQAVMLPQRARAQFEAARFRSASLLGLRNGFSINVVLTPPTVGH
jgi:hypothetical protein